MQRREQRLSVQSEHSMRQRLMLALREVGRLEAEKEELEEALTANRRRGDDALQPSLPSPESKKDTGRESKQMLRFRCQRLQRRVAELEAQQRSWEERAADGDRATTVSAQEWHRLSGAVHKLTKDANETFDALLRAENHSGRVPSAGEAHLRTQLASQLSQLESVSSSSPLLPRGFQHPVGAESSPGRETNGSSPPCLPRHDAAPQQELVDTLLQALGESDREISVLRDRVQASESRACSATESAAEAHRSEALLPHYRAAIQRYRRMSQELASRLEQSDSRLRAAEDQAAHWSRAWVQLDAWVRGHPAFLADQLPPPQWRETKEEVEVEEQEEEEDAGRRDHHPFAGVSFDVSVPPQQSQPQSSPGGRQVTLSSTTRTPARRYASPAGAAAVRALTPVLSARLPAPAVEPFSPQQASRPARKGVGNAEGVSLSAPGRRHDGGVDENEENEEVMQASLPRSVREESSGGNGSDRGVSSEGSSPWDELLSFGDALLAEADDALETEEDEEQREEEGR